MTDEHQMKFSRSMHPADTVVTVGNAKIGGGSFAVIAGPCAIESREQLFAAADAAKAVGADLLRAGAFKPRTSPYEFQGLGREGLRLLYEAKQRVDLPVVSELTDLRQLDAFDDVDVIQIGARSMQNYELLKELGKLRRPVLLKRGFGCTVTELLCSAEYLLAGGNTEIILCERGIRTFHDSVRFTLDLDSIAVIRERTHLPIIIDPSHAAGKAALVPSLALAAASCHPDGMMLEVHPCPSAALCDGAQALTPEALADLLPRLRDAAAGE